MIKKRLIHIFLHKHQQGGLPVFFIFSHIHALEHAVVIQNQSIHGVTVKHAIVGGNACQRGCLLFCCQTHLSFMPAAS